MSDDEQATIVGRMVLERKELIKQGVLLNEEIRRFSSGLMGIASRISDQGSVYNANPVGNLTEAELQLLESYPKLVSLLEENVKINKRYHELQVHLARFDLK